MTAMLRRRRGTGVWIVSFGTFVAVMLCTATAMAGETELEVDHAQDIVAAADALPAPGCFPTPASLACRCLDRSPVFKRTPLDCYFAFKERLHERTGFTWQVNYSAMSMHRTDRISDGDDYNTTGQLDLIGVLDTFSGAGQAVVYYMVVHQIAGLTTTGFGERNGNITPINDSDPAEFLRQAYYKHSFWRDRLMLMAGKTEPLLVFAPSRFAADDRVNFQAVPLSTIAAKDRTFSSLGALVAYKPTRWLTLGASVNELDPDPDTPPGVRDVTMYSLGHVAFDVRIPRLGQGIYRLNTVFTEDQGDNPKSDGVILRFDQDLGPRWGAFFNFSNTSIQTVSSPLSEGYGFGFYNRAPFHRSEDRAGIAVFRTQTKQGGRFREWGGEAFYRVALTTWCDFTLAAQAFQPAKGKGAFMNIGGRIRFKF